MLRVADKAGGNFSNAERAEFRLARAELPVKYRSLNERL